MGDVSIPQIAGVLEKLGIPPDQTQRLADALTALLSPVIASRGLTAAPQGMQELPVLNRPTETGPRPLTTAPAVPVRNVINLRREQPNA